jgi:peptidoglycan-associated lipoprotein
MSQNGALAKGLSIVVVTLACGCGSEPPPPPKAPPPPPAPTTTQSTAPSQVKRPVNVSDEIRGLCNLPEPKEAPKFEFDTADISGDDRTILQSLAKCMTDGPLKGKSVRLIGRADPRGEQEYNMALGAKRASNVKQYMTSLGITDNRMMQTSRGELDAKGTDEDTWRLDRRVDIELQK